MLVEEWLYIIGFVGAFFAYVKWIHPVVMSFTLGFFGI